MGKVLLKSARFMTDATFDWLYPERIQQLSKRHWTPVRVAKKAASFLAAENGKSILDIGSGVGKFSLIGAHYFSEATFFGIEQRSELHHYALAAKEFTRIENAEFMHGNFTQIDFAQFDHFYFYNAFFENIDSKDRIDHLIEYSTSLYHYYSRYLYKELNDRPRGTRLVTYHSLEDEVPPSYQIVEASRDFLLKMWVKK